MRFSIALCVVVVALVVWMLVDVRASEPSSDPPVFPRPAFFVRTIEQAEQRERQLDELRRRLHREHRRFVRARHRVGELKRTLMSTQSVSTAIDLACTVYGSCSTLRRRAWCESTYNPRAQNASGASGLFQFLPSTWTTTPFSSFSIFDPYANALAAGWMHANGRGGEWECR